MCVVRLVLVPGAAYTCRGAPTIDGPSRRRQRDSTHVIFPNQLSIKSAMFSQLCFFFFSERGGGEIKRMA